MNGDIFAGQWKQMRGAHDISYSEEKGVPKQEERRV